MLDYLGAGPRDYDARPVAIHRRGRWEFQAILSGTARLAHRAKREHPAGPALFVSGPDFPHGWSGSGAPCTVAVFHFRTVPDEVSAQVPEDGWRAFPLDAAGVSAVRGLYAATEAASREPRATSTLWIRRALLDLSLLALRLSDPGTRARDERRVDAVVSWYLRHLDRAPSLAQAARAHAVSVAHMRRIFHAVTGRSPKEVLAEARFRLAADLVSSSAEPLETIASRLGYSEPAAFSRAFKNRFGVPPSAWR